jgi:hypothetical protein
MTFFLRPSCTLTRSTLESYDSELVTPTPQATMFPAPTPIGSHLFERPAGEGEVY